VIIRIGDIDEIGGDGITFYTVHLAVWSGSGNLHELQQRNNWTSIIIAMEIRNR